MLNYKLRNIYKARIKFHRLWLCAQAEPSLITMLNVRVLLGSILEQGKRVIFRSYTYKYRGLRTTKRFLYSKLPYTLSEGRADQRLARIDTTQQDSGFGVLRRLVHGFLQRVVAPSLVPRNHQFGHLLGNVSPFFTLVGVSGSVNLSEKGLITVHEEIELLCEEIRKAVSRAEGACIPSYWNYESKYEENVELSLKNVKLGPIIDKGCNAVVYSASLNTVTDKVKDAEKMLDPVVGPLAEETPMLSSHIKNKKRTFHLPFAKKKKNKTNQADVDEFCGLINENLKEYPLAIKMMFNYEAESNFGSIMTAMHREILPAAKLQLGKEMSTFKHKYGNKQIPVHPNIVEMPFVFVDMVPMLPGADTLYPNALPKRLYADGYGRNMSLFCVMKRYDCTLEQYLSKKNLDTKTSFLLLTQLLEALLHLNDCGISHRDLKLDNILVGLPEGYNYPKLVVTDFGCCFCGQPGNLRVPFATYEADPRMGNAALMAPEVKNCVPGMLRSVDYSKNDLWAVGTLALEIFNQSNVFNVSGKNYLDSATYVDSDVAKLTKPLVSAVRHLLMDLLKKDPKERPSVAVAATICQLNLWAPSKWCSRSVSSMPSHKEISQWLLCLSTKVLCEIGTSKMFKSNTQQQKVDSLEYEIVSTFLKRVKYDDVVSSLKWIKGT